MIGIGLRCVPTWTAVAAPWRRTVLGLLLATGVVAGCQDRPDGQAPIAAPADRDVERRPDRTPVVLPREAARPLLESPAVRAADSSALKVLLDHYATVDAFVHTVADAPRGAARDAELGADVLVTDLALEENQRSLAALLQAHYGVVTAGRPSERAARAARRVTGAAGRRGDSAFMSELAVLYRDGIGLQERLAARLRGTAARALVGRMVERERATLEWLRRRHRVEATTASDDAR